jgi:hypothetical protein
LGPSSDHISPFEPAGQNCSLPPGRYLPLSIERSLIAETERPRAGGNRRCGRSFIMQQMQTGIVACDAVPGVRLPRRHKCSRMGGRRPRQCPKRRPPTVPRSKPQGVPLSLVRAARAPCGRRRHRGLRPP